MTPERRIQISGFRPARPTTTGLFYRLPRFQSVSSSIKENSSHQRPAAGCRRILRAPTYEHQADAKATWLASPHRRRRTAGHGPCNGLHADQGGYYRWVISVFLPPDFGDSAGIGVGHQHINTRRFCVVCPMACQLPLPPAVVWVPISLASLRRRAGNRFVGDVSFYRVRRHRLFCPTKTSRIFNQCALFGRMKGFSQFYKARRRA